jgi:hypothetical protein
MQIYAIGVSVAALLVSLFTLWFTVLRRGQVRSTHPSFIALRYDFVTGQNVPQAKVFLRPLLYSTGKRGHVIENLSLRVSEGARQAEFAFWGYGETDHLVIGGGLSIPESGVSTNHHFNPVKNDELFLFSGGNYTLELVAKLVGRHRPSSLWTLTVTVPEGVFSKNRVAQRDEVSFHWSPEQNKFLTSVRTQTDPVIRWI